MLRRDPKALFFYNLRKAFENDRDIYKAIQGEDNWAVLDKAVSLDNYLARNVIQGVDLVTAGRLDAGYAELVSAFDWVRFYNNYGRVFDALKELLASRYAFCLIDSRTGFGDISGICTMIDLASRKIVSYQFY